MTYFWALLGQKLTMLVILLWVTAVTYFWAILDQKDQTFLMILQLKSFIDLGTIMVPFYLITYEIHSNTWKKVVSGFIFINYFPLARLFPTPCYRGFNLKSENHRNFNSTPYPFPHCKYFSSSSAFFDSSSRFLLFSSLKSLRRPLPRSRKTVVAFLPKVSSST